MMSLPRKPKKNNFQQWLKWKRAKSWKDKEKKDAKDYGGVRTPRSGGLWNKPGDVSSADFLFDSKTTEKMSFSVSSKIVEKIYIEAIKNRKLPALSVELGDKTEFVVLRKDDFLMLINTNL